MQIADDIIARAVRPEESLPQLLNDIEGFVRRFISFQSEHQSAVVALWTLAAFAIDTAPAAPYLRVTSAVEESGKSTLLEVLRELLGKHGIGGESISPTAVFRTRDKVGPVALLLDEIDQTLRDRKDDGARDLLAIVNAGYRRAATAWRVVGREHEPRQFRAFGPCAIAGLGTLAATTESRCIPIVLERKDRGAGERWLPFRLAGEINALIDRAESWAATERVLDDLRAANPKLPPELRDRQVEVWWILFAIADAASEEWGHRARTAAVVLHTGRDAEDSMSLAVLLLSHIREIFASRRTDRLPTLDLLRALVDLEAGPWARWWAGDVEKAEKLDGPPPRRAASDLAAKLKAFRRSDGLPIKPRVIRMEDGRTPRGYLLEDLQGAIDRYLGPPNATNATDATPLPSPVASVASVASPPPNEDASGSNAPLGSNGDGPGVDADRLVALLREHGPQSVPALGRLAGIAWAGIGDALRADERVWSYDHNRVETFEVLDEGEHGGK